MFAIEPVWLYVVVPSVLVSVLILIRLWQERRDRRSSNASLDEDMGAGSSNRESAAEQRSTRTELEKPGAKGSKDCPHYAGYLYMKRGRDSTYIPSECYGCRKLLQCLYSPHAIEKVYGE